MYYPEHMYRKPSSGFFKKKSRDPKELVEERWLDSHRRISQEYERDDIAEVRGQLYRRYLEICWPYPFYG